MQKINFTIVALCLLLTVACKTTYSDKSGKTYPIVQVDNLLWMAENSDLAVEGSTFYNNNAANERLSGRVYTWQQAQQVCSDGWRLPTDKELAALLLKYGKISYGGENPVYEKMFGPYDPKQTALTYFKLTSDKTMQFPTHARPEGKAEDHRTMLWTLTTDGNRAFAIYWRAIDEYINHTSVHFSSYPMAFYGFCRCVKSRN